MPTPLDLEAFQARLWDFASHRVITVAGRTGLLSLFAQTQLTIDQASSSLELDTLATGKIIRALTALGILSCSNEMYQMVPSLAPHFQPGPEDLAPFLNHSHEMYEKWGENLEAWVRGEPTKRGGPPDAKSFGVAMQAMGSQTATILAEQLDMTGVSRMLDLGGGFGHFSKALCRRWPDLRATVLDTPAVTEMGQEAVENTDLSDRISFMGGDYLQTDPGDGYQLVLMANILHQEPAERASQLVAKAAGALAPGGKAVVLDFSIDDAQQENLLGALFAINMRSFGDTYTEAAITGWMSQAGLEDAQRIDANSQRWIIISHKP